MNVNLTHSGGSIQVEIAIDDLFAAIPHDQRNDFTQRVACDEAVIRHVMDQVLTGVTENGSHGADRGTDAALLDNGYPTALQTARENIARFAEPATRRYIERFKLAYRHLSEVRNRQWSESNRREEEHRAAVRDLRAQMTSAEAAGSYLLDSARDRIAELEKLADNT